MNYSHKLKTNATLERFYEALTTKIDLWWGKTTYSDEDFTVSFGKAYWKFTIDLDLKNSTVSWICIDGQPEFENEWVGTKVIWKMIPDNDGLILECTHEGLTPDFKCYDIVLQPGICSLIEA